MNKTVFLMIAIAATAMSASFANDVSSEIQVVFDRDVRPILSEKCFTCHGFDEAAREADLRLDTFTGATEEHDGVAAIVPGDPDASELISRIMSNDVDEVMPPPASREQLTSTEKEVLRRWIGQGAAYTTHWAFIPPKRPPLPEVTGTTHPIDRFIQARLSEEGLQSSAVAQPQTLIRRVSLDLVGLPPTLEEIDSFLQASEQDAEAAYQELVERLLASPHYGERWGRWWLDQARYADSNGYSIDGPRQIWKYRDWVVDALNADMPFDTFTIEQLAGDLLSNPTQSQKIATGFHRNTQINQEGGIDKEQYRVESIFDRVATTGTVWLGLSIGCAQCHDHKFDPITQKEFYQLFAFLNNQDEPSMKVYSDGIDVPALQAELAEVESQLSTIIDEQLDEIANWEQGIDEANKESLPKAVQEAIAVEQAKRSFAQKLALYEAAVELGGR